MKKYAVMIGNTPHIVSAKTKKEAFQRLQAANPAASFKLADVYEY